jgi:hypothetical protein
MGTTLLLFLGTLLWTRPPFGLFSFQFSQGIRIQSRPFQKVGSWSTLKLANPPTHCRADPLLSNISIHVGGHPPGPHHQDHEGRHSAHTQSLLHGPQADPGRHAGCGPQAGLVHSLVVYFYSIRQIGTVSSCLNPKFGHFLGLVPLHLIIIPAKIPLINEWHRQGRT